jgi:hypothetical protein
MANFAASSCSSSVFTFASRTAGSMLRAAASNTGANCLQGPHQGAQKSTTKGKSALTWAAKLLLLSGTGMAVNKGCLQAPHFPSWERRCAGILFLR